MENKPQTTMNKIGLINYEGNCLEAIKHGDFIFIKDQYGIELRLITPEALLEFINGEFDIVDSRGKSWNFPSQSEESKPKMPRVFEFLALVNNYEKTLYAENEHLIIDWSNDGTKTAGTLTRDIMKLINKQ
jgi:hypothetical protein